MNPDWQPAPEQLAAYFDGELEGRDDVAGLRSRIERWLSESPEGRAQTQKHRQLRGLWQGTSPVEPGDALWNAMWKRMQNPSRPLPARPGAWHPRRGILGWSLAGVALACLLVWWNLPTRSPIEPVVVTPTPGADEIFPVATAEEIRILGVEGTPFTDAVVVGKLPLIGPLELLDDHEFLVTSIKSDSLDMRISKVGKERPMIWAKLEHEE